MKVSKWVEFSTEVEFLVDADDIRQALAEAFDAANQKPEQAVNVHVILLGIIYLTTPQRKYDFR